MECVNPFEHLEIEEPLSPPPSGDPWELIVGEPALIAHILCLTYRDLQWHELGFNTYQTDMRYGPMNERIDEEDRHVICRNTCSLLSARRRPGWVRAVRRVRSTRRSSVPSRSAP